MTGRLLQTVLRQAGALAAEAGPDAVPDAELLARFAAGRDESAFAALVRRHGPLVWAACRHLLPNPADAEDAFQATFLVLVRSAKKVRAGSAVGGWLHGVAVRAAAKLRRSAARRRRREMRVAGPEADRPVPDGAWDELLAAVHEEVQQLPEVLRAAFVLCDLEGVRQPDAAARLGWKPGTLSGRLTKARQRLLDRLARRGIATGVAAGAVAVGAAAAGGAVPAALAVKVLALAGAGADAVPPALLELLAEVTPMTVNRTKLIAAAALVAGGLSIGVGAVVLPTADAQPPTGPGAPAGGLGLGSPPPGGSGPGGLPGGAPSGAPSPGAPGALPGGGDAASGAGLPGGPGAPGGPGGGEGAAAGGGGFPGMGGMMGGPGGRRSNGSAASHQQWEYKFTAKPKSAPELASAVVLAGKDGWEFVGVVEFSKADIDKARPAQFGDDITSKMSAVAVFKRSTRSTRTAGGGAMTGGMGMMPGGPGGVAPAGGAGGMPPGGGGPGGSMPGMPGAGRMGPGGGPPGFPGMPGGGGAPSQPRGFQVIALKYADSTRLAGTLQRLFANVPVQVAADDRTNSLIIKADRETLEELEALVQKLDVPDTRSKRGTTGSPDGTP